MQGLLVAAGTCFVAGAVVASWWLGVWGYLWTLNARAAALETRILSLESSRQRASGQQGQEVRQAIARKKDATEQALLEAARRGGPALVPPPGSTEPGVDASERAVREASAFFGGAR
jgi:hypothetical protein